MMIIAIYIALLLGTVIGGAIVLAMIEQVVATMAGSNSVAGFLQDLLYGIKIIGGVVGAVSAVAGIIYIITLNPLGITIG